MPTKHRRLCLAGIAHERSKIYGNFSTSAKRPEWNQDKSSIEPYQKADYLFSGAALVGVPLYFLTKGVLGTQGAAIIMVGAMLPFFFLAMYEKDGFPAEKILYFMLRQKVLTPGIRPYKSENLYEQLEEREKIRKEVCFLEEKAKGGSGKAKAAEK